MHISYQVIRRGWWWCKISGWKRATIHPSNIIFFQKKKWSHRIKRRSEDASVVCYQSYSKRLMDVRTWNQWFSEPCLLSHPIETDQRILLWRVAFWTLNIKTPTLTFILCVPHYASYQLILRIWYNRWTALWFKRLKNSGERESIPTSIKLSRLVSVRMRQGITVVARKLTL